MKQVLFMMLVVGFAGYLPAEEIPSANFYVSPEGNDANPGTLEKPFKTLDRAREAVRTIKWMQMYQESNMPSNNEGLNAARLEEWRQLSGTVKDIQVMLRGGRYYHCRPVVFDENDSSNYGFKIIYRNYPGETPVLVGGVPLKGWQPWGDHIFRAYVPYLKEGGVEFYQMFEDGRPAALARTPNEGWLRMADPHDKVFHYHEGDFDPTHFKPAQMRVRLIERGMWFSSYQKIVRIDAEHREIELFDYPQYPFRNNLTDDFSDQGQCYILQNALDLLDMPGEFYVDQAEGYVYYWPFRDDIEEAEIVIPMVESILKFEAYSWQYPVHDMVIEGLELECSRDAAVWRNGWNRVGENGHLNPPEPDLKLPPEKQYQDETDRNTATRGEFWGLIRLNNAEHITIRNCRMRYAGTHGVSLAGACAYNDITGCEIYQTGRDGVFLQGYQPAYRRQDVRQELNVNHHNTIHNNYIHHTGRLYLQGSGVRIGHSGYNRITNNRFTDISKSAVFLFSQWGVPQDLTCMNGNMIRNNEFFRCSTAGWDGGTIYIGASCNNTTFENNLFADVWSWAAATWPCPGAGKHNISSIDFDPGQCYNTIIRNNLLYGVDNNYIEIGRDDETIMYNNYFETEDVIKSRRKPYIPYPFSKPEKVHRETMGLATDYPFTIPKEITRPFELPIRSDFENTLSPFYLFRYSDGPWHGYLTTDRVHSGRYALMIDKDVCMFRYRHPKPVSARVSLWMYDDPAKTDAEAFVTVRNGQDNVYPFYRDEDKAVGDHSPLTTGQYRQGWHLSDGEIMAAVGVSGQINKDQYIVCLDGQVQLTEIHRQAGWHQVTFDVSSSEGCVIKFNDKIISVLKSLQQINIMDAGDNEFGSDSRCIGFDSFEITSF